MSRAQGVRKALLAGCVALGLTSTAFAQTSTPATGLGQAWPNTADVSANPNWHVYVFILNGIKYVQVNDLNGTVHAAVGTTSGAIIVLPMGVDAQNVTTTSTTSQAAQTVYQDATTTVTATPQSNGATTFAISALAACPQLQCSGPGSQ
jgi:threonine/homoserine efflux transporter RhtA